MAINMIGSRFSSTITTRLDILPFMSYRINPLYDKLNERFGDTLAIKEYKKNYKVIRYQLPRMRNYIELLNVPSFQDESIHHSHYTHLLFNMELHELDKRLQMAKALGIPKITTSLLYNIDPDVHTIYNLDLQGRELSKLYTIFRLADSIRGIYEFDDFYSALEFCYRSDVFCESTRGVVESRANTIKGFSPNFEFLRNFHILLVTAIDLIFDGIWSKTMIHNELMRYQADSGGRFSVYDFYQDIINYSRTGITKYLDLSIEQLLGMIFDCDPSIFNEYKERHNMNTNIMKCLMSATLLRNMGYSYSEVIESSKSLRTGPFVIKECMEIIQEKGYVKPLLSHLVYYRSRGITYSNMDHLSMHGKLKYFIQNFNLTKDNIKLFKSQCSDTRTKELDIYQNRDFLLKRGFSDSDIGKIVLVLGFPSKRFTSGWESFIKGRTMEGEEYKICGLETLSLFYLHLQRI